MTEPSILISILRNKRQEDGSISQDHRCQSCGACNLYLVRLRFQTTCLSCMEIAKQEVYKEILEDCVKGDQ